jgi:hypothetical protein
MPLTVLSDATLMEHGTAANLYDLFLSLYRSVAENGVSEIVREVFSSWESTEYSEWRNSTHPHCDAITNAIGSNPNDWIDDFSSVKDRLLAKLKALGSDVETLLDARHHEVGCVVTALRELDVIIGQALAFPPGSLTYPSPPRSNGYTLVRKPGPGFYTRYRAKENLEIPPPLEHGEFRESLGLVSTYVAHPLAGEHYFEWTIHRAPALAESVWREQMERGQLSFALVSFPHATMKPTFEFGKNCFLVKDLGPSEPDVDEKVVERVGAIVKQGGASVILFPELTASSALVSGLKSLLAGSPSQVGMLIPGSRHVQVSPGVWRNRCTALDPMGHESKVTHDKITRYALPRKVAASYGRDEAIETVECTEAPRRIRLYDSFALGRFAVLICRDVIEPQVPEFLRQHFLDHIFVLAMTPDLEDFLGPCSDLGRILDAGVFVVNTPFGPRPQPALIYVPVRGEPTLEACPQGVHEVCLHLAAFPVSPTV